MQQMENHDRTGVQVAAGQEVRTHCDRDLLVFWRRMATLAATTLLWRGTALGASGLFNPTAYEQFAPLGGTVGFLFCF